MRELTVEEKDLAFEALKKKHPSADRAEFDKSLARVRVLESSDPPYTVAVKTAGKKNILLVKSLLGAPIMPEPGELANGARIGRFSPGDEAAKPRTALCVDVSRGEVGERSTLQDGTTYEKDSKGRLRKVG